jgi:hypothetical protein
LTVFFSSLDLGRLLASLSGLALLLRPSAPTRRLAVSPVDKSAGRSGSEGHGAFLDGERGGLPIDYFFFAFGAGLTGASIPLWPIVPGATTPGAAFGIAGIEPVGEFA